MLRLSLSVNVLLEVGMVCGCFGGGGEGSGSDDEAASWVAGARVRGWTGCIGCDPVAEGLVS